MRRSCILAITALLVLASGCSSDDDSTTPADTVALVASSVVLTPYLDGFRGPVEVAWRTGDPAIYVVDQPGEITRVVDGVSGPAVLDISDLLSCCGEQGLLGLAFHPTESLAYVNYTDPDGDTVIAEYVVGADGVFEAASRRTVIIINQPYSNHNGGKVAFGPDGMLYIGMGDGGSGGDPERRALDLSQPLGQVAAHRSARRWRPAVQCACRQSIRRRR